MRNKKNTTKLGLYVTTKSDGDWFHVNASVVTLGLNAWERSQVDAGRGEEYTGRLPGPDAVRNASDDDYSGLYLNGLVVTSQGNNSDTNRRLYGFGVRYQDVFSVDESTAERMAKTLRTVRVRMDKVAEKFGQPGSFAQYLAHVAHAVGAETFVFPRENVKASSYSDRKHFLDDVKFGMYRVDRKVDEWVNANKPKTEEEVANA